MKETDTLQALADRQAISDLIHRYCRAVDRLDIPLGHSIWNEGGHADYGAVVYQGAGKGVIDQICAQHRHLLHHSHQVSNILIELDGDSAGSEAYVTASLRFEKEGQLMQMTVWARYCDQWSRRDGRWGIDKRVMVSDFNEIRPVSEMNRAETRRDHTDPSYTVLRKSA